jgi:signal transduction histidine kinase/DNA-binding response OmpR family regulator
MTILTFFRNLTIRAKVLTSALSVLFLLALFTVLYFPARQERATMATMRARTTSNAEMVALGVGVGLGLNQYSAVAATLAWAKQDPDLSYIVVLDSERTVFAQFNPRRVVVPSSVPSPPFDTVRQEGRLLHTAVPIGYDGRNYGTLLLGMSLDRSNQRLASDRWAIAAATAVMVVVGGLISAFFAYLISAPLAGLRRVADEVAAGHYDLEMAAGGADEVGALSRAFGIMVSRVRDAIDRLNAQTEELRAARDGALAAMQAKAAFLATMSHEIRTPMNGVLGMLGLLMDDELSPKQRQYAAAAHGSAESLLAIIDDVLDVSKIDAGKLAIVPADFDVRRMVEEAAEIIAPRAHAKGLELIVTVGNDVPDLLCGDAGRLRQILVNLAGNAVKFTERGEVTIEAAVAHHTERGIALKFTVTDTGIGIPAEVQGSLFQPFVQAEASTTRRYGGTGLGLAICKQLSELMGGEIGMESTAGYGSAFWFTARLRHPETRSARLPRRALGRLRVLVVDDNASSREMLVGHLASWGMVGIGAAGGDDAVQILRAAAGNGMPYDVALVDHHMPVQTGVELIKAMRKDPETASVRTVLLTTLDLKDQRDAKSCGASAIVTKPLRQSLLFDSLAHIMARTESKEAGERARTGSLESSSGIAAPSGARILLVEDNDVNQAVASDILSRLGHEVEVAANGRLAVEAAMEHRYDLILMDCQMPVMDGFEATTEIRRRQGVTGVRVPIVAMTANAMQGDRERCLAAGMDDYLSKPIRRDRLTAMLSQWLPTVEAAPAAAAPRLQSSPPIRVSEVEALLGSDPDAVRRYLRLFVTTSAPLLADLACAVTGGEPMIAAQLAHKLRGPAATLGADRFAAVLSEMEERALEGHVVDMAGFRRVEQAFDEIQAFVGSIAA